MFFRQHTSGHLSKSAKVGDPPSNMNTIATISHSLKNEPLFALKIQTQLNTKQDVINDDSLPISRVKNLQTILENTYDKSEVNDLLDEKQDVIGQMI